ncbi:MAG: hypothetical protein GX410_08510 [Elusimicrobia bacterium]|nr:hypothetical protein [Elusimicrobiota bacterium]
MKFFSLLSFALLFPSCAAAQSKLQAMAVFESTAATPSPEYVSMLKDLNRYDMYANGGWDGNWYVGYNSCWIVRVPPAPEGAYVKAYIGAKLGRAKTVPLPDKPWERAAIAGKIMMGISPTPAFTSQQSFLLVENQDIPREAGPKETLKEVGSAQWFWAEIPLSAVSNSQPNYLALWAISEQMTGAETSPIVAGAEAKYLPGPSAWVNRSMLGTPPRDADTALETPINGLLPALALKLIPAASLPVKVENLNMAVGENGAFVSFNALGQDVRAAWVEISFDRFDWQRVSPFLYHPPFTFTLPKDVIPENDRYFIRGVAVDMLETHGYSKEMVVKTRKNQH